MPLRRAAAEADHRANLLGLLGRRRRGISPIEGASLSGRRGRQRPPQAGGERGPGHMIWAEATGCAAPLLLPAPERLAKMAPGSRGQIWRRGGGQLLW
jgi:hypothetical protein